jgi:hypothetical protein
LKLSQGWYQVNFYGTAITVLGTWAAVTLDIPFKPLVKVLCHCKAAWRDVDAFIK